MVFCGVSVQSKNNLLCDFNSSALMNMFLQSMQFSRRTILRFKGSYASCNDVKQRKFILSTQKTIFLPDNLYALSTANL